MVATYKRHDILSHCLRLAGEQTRPPAQVVVVDASPDFEAAKARLVAEFGARFPNIPLDYVKADRASSAAQRNQGIPLCHADVVFMIDDDSLMYPDCAEEIMKVYESDSDGTVLGVSALGVPEPPGGAGPSLPSVQRVAEPRATPLRELVKRVLATDRSFFVPYDAEYPERPIAESIEKDAVGRIQVMAGYAMTFRRSALEAERFSEVLARYAAGEDQDLSYRISRRGALLNAVRARLCHMQAAGGRLSTFTVGALANLNPIVLHRFYSSDEKLSQARLWRCLAHRFLVSSVKELSAKQWKLPRTRGTAYAALWFPTIWMLEREELERWYPEFQGELTQQTAAPRLPPLRAWVGSLWRSLSSL